MNPEAPRGGGSVSALLRQGSDGTSAGQRPTSQHDNVAVSNSTRWQTCLTWFLVGGLFLQAIFTLRGVINSPDWRGIVAWGYVFRIEHQWISFICLETHACRLHHVTPGLQMHLLHWNNHLWMQHNGIFNSLECKNMNYLFLTLWRL